MFNKISAAVGQNSAKHQRYERVVTTRANCKLDNDCASTISFESFLGHAIHVARLIQGFTQVQLAEALSVRLDKTIRQTYISKVEKGESIVAWKRFGLLCSILKVSPLYVLEIAVSLAEQGNEPNDALLREALTDITKKLANKGRSHSLPVGKLLRAVQQ
jgi:transcriptional regulator with XRE-family HTH domain